MAGFIGRVLTVTLDGVPLASVKTKRVSITHGEIDVSHEEQDGFRRLLAVRDTTSMVIDVEGICTPANVNRLMAAYFADQFVPVGVELPTGRFFSGDCVLTGLSFQGPMSQASIFTATLTFSGEVAQVFDPALYGGSGGRGGIVAEGGGGGGAGDGGASVPDYYEQGEGEDEEDEPTPDIFLDDSTWEVPPGVTEIDILCVGGGGGGDCAPVSLGDSHGGGGGGGAVREFLAVAVAPGDELQISVGAGGTKGDIGVQASAGGNSSVFNVTTSTMLADVGGGGGGLQFASGQGGWASVGAGPQPPVAGDPPGGDGGNASGSGVFNAEAGGGGGGAGGAGTDAVGATPGNGGDGVVIGGWGAGSGAYGGGGGGWGGPLFAGFTIGTRGSGGGAPNTGGGGNAGPSDTVVSAAEDGYSGIVLIRYNQP